MKQTINILLIPHKRNGYYNYMQLVWSSNESKRTLITVLNLSLKYNDYVHSTHSCNSAVQLHLVSWSSVNKKEEINPTPEN